MKWKHSLAVLALAFIASPHPAGRSLAADAISALPQREGSPDLVSVMTYNVKGLPWPIARGRASALSAIGNRLAELRRLGRQPHLVLLQEAFTSDAKKIGEIGGYRFVADGPDGGTIARKDTEPLGESFARNSSWLKGETEGKWLDSGLVLLSDYPLVSVKRLAFPDGACAGFDCLAAKGVMVAKVELPGNDRHIAVAVTHLNSRHHTGVSVARSNRAFAWQIDAARAFVAKNVSNAEPVIFAGDFNFGRDRERLRHSQSTAGPLPGSREALRLAVADGEVAGGDEADAVRIAARGSDRQYFRSGSGLSLSLTGITVPFGTEPDGTQLSDHMGFVAEYRISDARPAT